ncbi:DUF2147 domain-containing protein [Ferrovibrio terrae]|uniref:DUF2147 domain-containing protein n=1 Tax=Ferrovibrio terrae TaxID=2594003 RepID=UPI0031378C1C
MPHPVRNIMSSVILALSLAVPAYAAEPTSPIGRWKTIDDETNTPRSIVEIQDVNGELQGRILQIFLRPDEKPDPRCEACEGDRKDQPVIGMVFLWGLKADGTNEWAGGGVLDPKNGKTYNAKASLTEAGQKLRLRGYIGTPILGRTQVWLREP